ncbi:MAG: sugar phosphate isomerase/epimerase [Armatimonadetes bacterium]|nr:sugar phosphate isomerase/epimerase [Armatimonadota bacterium]
MFKNLVPGALGVRADFEEGLALARRHGFQGLDLPLDEAAALGAAAVRARYTEHGLLPGGFGLAVNWREDEATWRVGLERLPAQARLAREVGTGRCYTWVPAASNDRPFAENFAFHVQRLRPVAAILAEAGCHLGLEFIGPATIRRAHRYEFIWTMPGMLELCAAVGDNAGLLLDGWHWYTAGHTVADLLTLRPEQVVYVHVNDAPAGVPVDQQIDSVRCLPGETGVIDIAGFLRALQQIGYDGPVTPEPFSQQLRSMTPDEAVQVTAASMDRIWAIAGL